MQRYTDRLDDSISSMDSDLPRLEVVVPLGKLDSGVRAIVEATLKRWQSNKSRAAKQLGVSRRTLQKWLSRWAEEDKWWGKR